MALFVIKSGLNEKQSNMIKEIFKYVMLLSIFHILANMMDIKKIGLFGDKLFDEKFLIFLLLIAITFMAYYLVILELIEII